MRFAQRSRNDNPEKQSSDRGVSSNGYGQRGDRNDNDSGLAWQVTSASGG
jgi:hypothetical protein